MHDPPDQPESGDGNYINALSGYNDLYGTGWDWVIKAFELARYYFPDSTKLMINEYHIVNNGGNTTTYLQIINLLLLERNLIDGIGVQAHAFSTRGSSATMGNILDRLAETGLPIQVCEMDIDGQTDEIQLNDYKRIFPTFWEHPGVEGITLWDWRPGLWRQSDGAYLVYDNGAERPALKWLRTYIINPKAPKLVSPINLARDVPRNPVLTWQPSDSATSYNVQISTSSAFTDIVLDTTATDTTVHVQPLQANTRYYWHVKAINDIGTSEYSNSLNFQTGDEIISSVNKLNKLRAEYKLYQNYPNPFNPVTNIEFTLPEKRLVIIIVYDVLGNVVKKLASGYNNAGHHKIKFDASQLSSGVYLYSLNAGDFVTVKKLIIAK